MERRDGFAPLASYSLLGDCQALALVAEDGSIDWFAAPRLDTPPVCSALLDPEAGGAITLAPTVEHEASQRYLPDTMVLETTFRCADSVVRVTDALNRSPTGPLPWVELARRVEVTGDPVAMRWQVRPGHRLRTERSWVQWCHDTPVLHVGSVVLAVVTQGVDATQIEKWAGGACAGGEFTLAPGERAVIAVVATQDEPVPIPAVPDIDARIDSTTRLWEGWSRHIDFDGPHQEAVRRSALALKAMTVIPTDGMAAAATTSLPERIGGNRNFDYRFGWVRDASFAIDAQHRLGLLEEVHGSLTWLLRAVRRTAPRVRAMYDIDGHPASGRMVSADQVPGYRGSLPVHVGNSAAEQLQLGAYGDFLEAVANYAERHGCLDPASATAIAEIVDDVCDRWQSKDSGLWELGDQEHYTSSKIGCWVALDRGVRLAEQGQVPALRVDRWRRERDAVHAWVDRHCWSETKQSYTFHAGTDDLDAAVLLAARTGFLDGGDPRLATTVDAIRTELGAGGALLYRYTGMSEKEGAFLACSCWLVEALDAVGRRDEAVRLLDEVVGHSGTTGLMTEEIDAATHELLGNIPQALSHLAVINAATRLAH